ncbi:hypothetical protein P7H21_17015 [Paenibacillus larvae]|nr:hypothetical protein [Paenibacillus larvae]MDT2305306.1 hypothetical protein [Paenibacillus larvae]
MSFKELLLQVRQIVADAVEHQNFPIDLLFDQPGKKTKRQIPPCTARL